MKKDNKDGLVEDFYDVCDLFNDDINIICDFLKHKKGDKIKKYILRQNMEYLRLWNIEKEINFLLEDVSRKEILTYVKNYKMIFEF